MSCKLDSEMFIDEVRKRPAIWDLNSAEYTDKDVKKTAWKEIIDTFIETEDATDLEMAHFERELQRKWKNLRDCFSREISRRKQACKGGQVSRRTYRYFNNLCFLKSTVKNADDFVEGDEVCDVNDVGVEINEQDSPPAKIKGKDKRNFAFVVQPDRSKKRKSDSKYKIEDDVEVEFEDDPIFFESENISNAGVPSSSAISEEDDDKLFFLSLVRPFKDIPRHKRFKIRMELMEVIHRAQENSQ